MRSITPFFYSYLHSITNITRFLRSSTAVSRSCTMLRFRHWRFLRSEVIVIRKIRPFYILLIRKLVIESLPHLQQMIQIKMQVRLFRFLRRGSRKQLLRLYLSIFTWCLHKLKLFLIIQRLYLRFQFTASIWISGQFLRISPMRGSIHYLQLFPLDWE